MSEFLALLEQIKKDLKRLDELVEEDKEKDKISLAQKIKYYRLSNKLSQEDLAKRLHVTKPCIIKWEQAKVTPQEANLMRFKEIGIID